MNALKKGYNIVAHQPTLPPPSLESWPTSPERQAPEPKKAVKADPSPSERSTVRKQVSRQRSQRKLLVGGLAVVLTLTAVAVVALSGVLGGGQGTRGAPVTLIYNDSAFTMFNGGNYTLQVAKMKFIRGAEGGGDDYNGDRIPGDRVPPGECVRIALQGPQTVVPQQCSDVVGRDLLLDPERFFWRSETPDGVTVSSFNVLFDGQVIATCPTVSRGASSECRFAWPVLPTPVPTESTSR